MSLIYPERIHQMLATLPNSADTIDLPTYLRLFQLRNAQIMWFLGAGASFAAGIKTATDMIWEFKQKLYCSEKRVPLSFITDTSDPAVQQKMQSHFDAQGKFPALGAEDEYSFYFDATYPGAQDRRKYIEKQVENGKPSYGHYALGILMQKGLCNVIWTTNFDHIVEDAAFKILGSSGKMVVADLGEPRKLSQAWTEQRWPIYGKLHGDYHSQQLKNTEEELRQQDEDMRRVLIDACKSQGLAIVGYSGRDASIMEALEAAIDNGRGYPAGLFWFKRSDTVPYKAVTQLIDKARAVGIEARFVEVETFDELLSDIVRFIPETEKAAQEIRDVTRPRLAKTPFRIARSKTPAIRTNALPIISYPVACRLIVCNIGGWREIQEAISQANVDIVAHRTSAGVVAFGRDTDIRRAFEPYKIDRFDIHAITPDRLIKPTGERLLIADALFRAVARRPELKLERRGANFFLYPDLSKVKSSIFHVGDTKAVDYIGGKITKSSITWSEACVLRIDYRLDRLWLLINPVIKRTIPENTPESEIDRSSDFIRERSALRRNKSANAMLDGWSKLITSSHTSFRLRTFDIADGYDAEFEIMRVSGFSGVER